MATERGGWLNSQDKRIGVEEALTGAVLVFAFLWTFQNWVMLGAGLWLFSLQFIRRRALNTEDEAHAKRVFRVTNPFLVLPSILVVYFSLLRGLQLIPYTRTFSETIFGFIALCVVVSLAILVIEDLGHGEYFEWWAARAEKKAENDDTGMWERVAWESRQLSPIALSPEEAETQTRQLRAKTRSLDGPYQPLSNIHSPPTCDWSWLKALWREARTWRRLLPIVVGITFFTAQGFGGWSALAWSLGVWFGSSLLADHIKYLYAFHPVKEGTYQLPNNGTMFQRFLQLVGSYSAANLLVFLLLWAMF